MRGIDLIQSAASGERRRREPAGASKSARLAEVGAASPLLSEVINLLLRDDSTIRLDLISGRGFFAEIYRRVKSEASLSGDLHLLQALRHCPEEIASEIDTIKSMSCDAYFCSKIGIGSMRQDVAEVVSRIEALHAAINK